MTEIETPVHEFGDPPVGIRRHGGDGRPYIQPADGSKPRWYSRASTLAGSLEKSEALTKWKLRKAATGLAQRRDLVQLVQSDPNDFSKVDDAVESAIEFARASEAANTGTALHRMTEFVDQDQWPIGIDGDTERSLLAYKAAMQRHGVKHVAAECFVACDEAGVAGTFDRLSYVPSVSDKPVIMDLKTGQWETRFPHKAAIQLAFYSRSQFYYPVTEFEGRRGLDLREVADQDKAVMIWMPVAGPRAFTCSLWEVDIRVGWEMAMVATGVREWLRSNPIRPLDGDA